MAIDYTLRYPLEVKIGSLDITSTFKSLVMGSSNHEPGSSLVWSASLEFMYGRGAILSGITESQFDPFQSGSLWLPGINRLTIKVGTFSPIIFRVESTTYNRYSKVLNVTAVQQLTLYSKPVPEMAPELVYNDSDLSTEIPVALRRLFDSVNTVASEYPMVTGAINLGGLSLGNGNLIWGQRSVRDPIQEVGVLTKQFWAVAQQSLTTEVVTVDPIDYNNLPVLFARSLSEVIVDPDTTNINFHAPKTIAFGSAELPDDCPGDDDQPTDVNAQGYPKVVKTSEQKPLGVLFPKLAPNPTPVDSQRKVIKYYYTSDPIQPGLPLEENPKTYPPIEVNDQSGLYMTVTEVWEPLGVIFPKLGTNMEFAIRSEYTETARTKVTREPYSIVFPKGSSTIQTFLTTSKVERLNDNPVKPGKGGRKADGTHQCTDYVEPAKPVEVDIKLATKGFKGEAFVNQGATFPMNYSFTWNIGYCSSQVTADLCAARLATRELGRKYADIVSLALPVEFISAGMPHLFNCFVDNKVYFPDSKQVTIAVDDEGRLLGQMKFTGLTLSTLSTPVPNPPLPPPYLPTGSTNEALVALSKVPNLIDKLILTNPLEIQL